MRGQDVQFGNVEGAEGLQADPDVVVGYAAGRGVRGPLVLGRGARLRSGTVLYDGTRIGDGFQSGHHVVVREECELGDGVAVWSNSVIDYGCRLGDRVKVHTNCYVAQFTELGDDAFLAPGVSIANDLYPGQDASAQVMAGPRIGRGAQIGVNTTILPYVRIGDGVIVGAGSVVSRDLPDGVVAYGNPARPRGRTSQLRDIAERIVSDPESASRFRMGSGTGTEQGDERGTLA